MQFHVGPWVYRVRISVGPLLDESGREAAGLCAWSDREIHLSGLLPVQQRIDTLLHELRHAWRHHFGQSSEDEDDANNASSFAVSAMRELLRQGGEPALRRLTHEGIIDRGVAGDDVPGRIVGSQCLHCLGLFAPQQIVNAAAEFSAALGGLVIRREVYCDFCGIVQQWYEMASQAGCPTGCVIAAPIMLRGEEAAEWLRKFGYLSHLIADG